MKWLHMFWSSRDPPYSIVFTNDELIGGAIPLMLLVFGSRFDLPWSAGIILPSHRTSAGLPAATADSCNSVQHSTLCFVYDSLYGWACYSTVMKWALNVQRMPLQKNSKNLQT